jgi:cellulose 1,4-beta-cellobiosidase
MILTLKRLKQLKGFFSLGRIALIAVIASFLFWPSHGSLQAQGGHSITLAWKAPASGGAPTSYNIKRSTTTGTEITISSVPASTLTFSDTTGTGGTTYFYTITAVNSGGEGTPSNEVSATFLAVVPGPPSGLTAVSN